MTTRYYTAEHEWLLVEGDTATVGISIYAQDALGDVVFVELPDIGSTLAQGEVAGVVESVKAASDIYMPVDGEVIATNQALADDPSLANTAPLAEGWFFKIKLSQPEQLQALLDEAGYLAQVQG